MLAEVGGGRWSPERNATTWVRFTLTAHLRQARTLLRRITESERLWGDLEELAKGHRLPERIVPVLFDSAIGLRVRNSTYRAIAHAEDGELTEATASRHLRQMVQAGLLKPQGEKRGRFYTATKEVLALRRAIIDARDRQDDSNPFEGAPEPGQLFAPVNRGV